MVEFVGHGSDSVGMHLSRKKNKRSSKGAKTKGLVRDLVNCSIRETYSMKVGYLMTLILAVMLWWIPAMGPMIAGYVGGRKSGTAVRGFTSSFAVALTIAAYWILMSLGMFSGQSISAYLTNLAEGSAFEPAVRYIASLFTGASSTATVELEPLFMLVVFGMIGGFIANQVRREVKMIAVAGSASQIRHIRSLDLYAEGKRTGFESFDDCSAVRVNAMPPSEPAARAAEPKPKQSTVTTTAEMKAVTTSTASVPVNDAHENADNPFAELVARSTAQEDRDKPSSGNDFEYI